MEPFSKKVGIVIVNYNGLEISRECIESLLQLEYTDFILIFVDNGSTDGSGKAIAEKFKDMIHYLPLQKNLGVTGGNNAGIDYALKNGCKHILFLNNDTIVEKTFLNYLVETSNDYENVLVVPKIICYYDQKRLDRFVGSDINWLTAQPLNYTKYPEDLPKFNIKTEVQVTSTCCLLIPSTLIRDIGKMDENYFMYFDDSDFTIRASRSGYKIIYDPMAVIYHKCNVTTSKQASSFEFYLQNRNVFYFYRKLCNDPLKKYFFLSKKIIYLFLHSLISFIEGKPAKRKAVYYILRDILTGKMGHPPKLN